MNDGLVDIYDSTLRDGAQTPEVNFTPDQKMTMAEFLIEKARVNAIEVASAKVSEGEFEAVRLIAETARQKGYLEKVEVLGFLDGEASLDWVHKSGARVINLLGKGSLKHLATQRDITPQEQLRQISDIRQKAAQKDMRVNVYLEAWSDGMKNSHDFVHYMMQNMDKGVGRVMLADTLGILSPHEVYLYVKEMTDTYPEFRFDFHAHNDYGLAVANSMAAAEAGAKGIHTCVNGLGERAGNTNLAVFVAALNDLTQYKTRVRENSMANLCNLVEELSGVFIPENMPVIGPYNYIQGCGVHANGDKAGLLYRNPITINPSRFGINSNVLSELGAQSGKDSIQDWVNYFEIELSAEEVRKVTERIKELADRGFSVLPTDFLAIVGSTLGREDTNSVKLVSWTPKASYSGERVNDPQANASVTLKVGQETYGPIEGIGNGQIDAFSNAVAQIYESLGKVLPALDDYRIRIPPGGKTSALVEARIRWRKGEGNKATYFVTRGIDPDQNMAAADAIIRMLNYNGFDKVQTGYKK